jgi:hypothetical protein
MGAEAGSADVTSEWVQAIPTESEMAGLVRSHDWAATPLGPPQHWPGPLRTAVRMVLTSNFPMLVVWGPELIKIYNDGYRVLLGADKHPRALGAPAREVWGEIWEIIEPMFERVMTTGEATWDEDQLLVLERNGFAEECYFTYGYSPLFDDDGRIGGVLDVVTETSDVVLARRRMELLAALGGALSEGADLTELCVRATTALGGSAADVAAADLYLWADGEPVLVSSARRVEGVDLEAIDLAAVAEERAALVIGRTLGSDGCPGPATHVISPLGGHGGAADGLLVMALNPRLPFDDAYEGFASLVAQSIGAALERAYRQAVEIGAYRRISDTLQAAMLKPASDLPTVAARYLPAEGNLAVGGDWYDVIDVGGDRRALVVGDCVGHGLDAAGAMSQLRSAARAMLLEGRGPAETLDGLDLFAQSVDHAFCATVAVAVVERGSRSLTYARAGHLPPLVVDAEGATRLDGSSGPPLGAVPGTVHEDVQVALRGDELILLFSDGLVERRGEVIDVGLDRLAKSAMAAYGSSVQGVADQVLEDLLSNGSEDDVVLVVKQLSST